MPASSSLLVGLFLSTSAIAVTRVPEIMARQRQERPSADLSAGPDLAQIANRLSRPRCPDAARAGMQHLDAAPPPRGQVERREMRPLLDDAEKHHFAVARRSSRDEACPYLGNSWSRAATTARGRPPSSSITRFWLRQPGRRADGISDALDDPVGYRCGAGRPARSRGEHRIWRSHAATLAHPPAPGGKPGAS